MVITMMMSIIIIVVVLVIVVSMLLCGMIHDILTVNASNVTHINLCDITSHVSFMLYISVHTFTHLETVSLNASQDIQIPCTGSIFCCHPVECCVVYCVRLLQDGPRNAQKLTSEGFIFEMFVALAGRVS
jgi:hypothetical protein